MRNVQQFEDMRVAQRVTLTWNDVDGANDANSCASNIDGGGDMLNGLCRGSMFVAGRLSSPSVGGRVGGCSKAASTERNAALDAAIGGSADCKFMDR
jgi:hypothetical protein